MVEHKKVESLVLASQFQWARPALGTIRAALFEQHQQVPIVDHPV
jgi:hypothetical protein